MSTSHNDVGYFIGLELVRAGNFNVKLANLNEKNGTDSTSEKHRRIGHPKMS